MRRGLAQAHPDGRSLGHNRRRRSRPVNYLRDSWLIMLNVGAYDWALYRQPVAPQKDRTRLDEQAGRALRAGFVEPLMRHGVWK